MATPADIQAATAAVAAGTQTAEQAALVNQSYLSNSLPVLPTVAPNASAQDYGQYSQYQREQVYNSNQQNNLILTWNTQGLTDPANQQGKAVYLTPTEYQQQYGATDAQREQIRYNIFNNPAAVNPNTVPADMQGLYGTQLRDQQSDYYRANPSAEFQRITQQYEANRYGSVGSGSNYTYNYGSSKNPFDPNSAAGIAWLVGRQGGNITESMRERGAEDYFFQTGGMISPTDFGAMVGVGVVSGISTVPTRSTGSGPIAGMSAGSQFVDDVDIYMAVGGYQGVKVPDSKLAVDYQTGEFGVYQKMGTHNIYGLVGGGGWNSLQSGMFSFGESLWDKEHTFSQSDIGKMTPVSKSYMETHSKAGAEAYGGFSRLLNGNLLQSDDAVSRYGNWNNLANYVQPVAATKGAVKGADIPWTMDTNAPAAQYMDQSGLTGQTFDVSMPDFAKGSDNLVGRTPGASSGNISDLGPGDMKKPFVSVSAPAKTADMGWSGGFGNGTSDKNPTNNPFYGALIASAGVAGVVSILFPKLEYPEGGYGVMALGFGAMAFDPAPTATIRTREEIEGSVTGPGDMKKPFVSTYTPPATAITEPNEYKPSGFLGLGGLLPEMPSYDKVKSYSVNRISKFGSDPIGGMVDVTTDLYGAPISLAGGLASRFTFGASEIVYKPEPIIVKGSRSESSSAFTTNLPETITTETYGRPRTTTFGGGNQTISELGGWLSGASGLVDTTNKTAVDIYNSKAAQYNAMSAQNPRTVTESGGFGTITTVSGGTLTTTTNTTSGTDKIYASEWDRFVEGSGRVFRFVTGMTLEKQEAYFETIKNAPGAIGEAQRGLFYFGTEIINKPAELAPAAILGWGIGGAARMTPGFLTEVGAGTGFTAQAANFLSTPGGSSLAKAGLFGAFGGAYTWGVTEGLTASADKTKENIYRSTPTLIAMYGGAGGFNWVGETKFVSGVSSPSGATFGGVQVQGVSFGGGRTPTGGKYVGAFSPTESYVFTGKPQGVPTGSVPAFEGGVRLGLPDLSRSSVSKASGIVESAESYQYMDLSGRSRPFSVNTVNEIQVDTLSKFRDTSGRADPFTIRTEGNVGAARASAVPDIIRDTSGGSQPFSVKTQAEVGSGYWDTAERFGGDVSGKARSFSVTSENEYLSSLPSDISGKADPFTMKTQGEIMSVWEQERFNKAQERADMVWARKTASNRVEPGFMEKMIDTEYTLTQPEQATATWKSWKPEPQTQVSAMEYPFSSLNPKRVYADAEQVRSPFSIPGVSDTALSTELAGMHPAYRGARAPFSIQGVSDASLAIDMARMHPAYSTPGRNTEAGITWGFGVLDSPRHQTRLEEEAASRSLPQTQTDFRMPVSPATSGTLGFAPLPVFATGTSQDKLRKPAHDVQLQPWAQPVPAPSPGTPREFMPVPYLPGSTITETPSGGSRRTTEFVPYTGKDITEITGSSTKRTTGFAPYFKTTPYESPYTKTKPFPEEKPYKWNTPTPPPPDTTRRFPDYVPPLVPTGGLPWGGAGAESPFSRKRKAAFVETFNMGLDMGFTGRKGRAAKSYTTPAKYKRKPAAAKPAKKAAPKPAAKSSKKRK